MAEDRGTDKKYLIPNNFAQSSRILGMRKRNLIEAAVMVIIVVRLVLFIPLVTQPRIIACVVSGAAVALVFIRGVHNRSITEWIIDRIIYQIKYKKVHYRTVKYDKYRSNAHLAADGSNMSYAERGIELIKNTIEKEDENGNIRDPKKAAEDFLKEAQKKFKL